ncbi:MAG: hypothetical protein V4563_17130 [Pseudomonadota bacterium]
MHSQNFKHLFHLDPAPDGAAGGAADSSLPAGNDAAPAFDASKFVPREELDSLRSEYGEFRQTAEQRFQDYDSRLPKPVKEEAKADVAPKAADYDFNKEGEFERFMDDRAAYKFNQEFSTRETKYKESQREQSYKEYVQSTQDAHAERADQFRAANPDYDPNKSILLGNDQVALAVLKSPYSAHIHNYLQKNPDKVAEIRKLAKSDPADAVMTIGMIAAQFKAQETAVPQKQKAAGTSTTVGGFPNKSSGTRAKSDQEIYDEWHK